MATSYVEALLAERASYIARDLPTRVAAVDAELARFGIAVDDVEHAVDTLPGVERADGRRRRR